MLLAFQKAQYEAYLVGGCVRDVLLGKTPKDWDIATSATPEEVMALFPKTVPTGLKHGTVTVIDEIVNEHYEVTTYRTEGTYSDSRHPDEVTFVKSIEEDLARRDFSMNAIAWNPLQSEVVDPFGGVKDLEFKRIRTVGNAVDRYTEDPLRMMRAIRFSSQLGFNIDGQTIRAISRCHDLIKKISNERIRDELCKILMSDEPELGIGTMFITGLLDHILPELSRCFGFDQQNPHHNKDVGDHILAVLQATPADLKTRLAALFHDIGKPDTFELVEVNGKPRGRFYGHDELGATMTREIMTRLRFPSDIIEDVVLLVRYHMARVPKLRPKNIKRLINKVGEHNIWLLVDLLKADVIGHKRSEGDMDGLNDMIAELEAWEQEPAAPMSAKDLAVNGEDIMKWLDIKPGPFVGYVLNQLLEMVLDHPELNTKEVLYGIVNDENERWSAMYEQV